MRTDTTTANCKYWNSQHAILQRLLMKEKDYRKAVPIFSGHHEAVHAAKLRAGDHWSFQDEVLSGLADEQMRCVPKGCPHSVAWKIWHITRCEDVTMNLLLADSPQVLNTCNWLDKLGLTCAGVGNEMSPKEIVELSLAINLKALLAYRLAVGKRTQQIVRHIKPDELWGLPTLEQLKRITDEHAVGENATWLIKYWGGHPKANLLLMPATRHCFVHFNETKRMLPKLRRLQEKRGEF